MTLYEYTRVNKSDFDCYDNVIDISVTVCFIDDADIEKDDLASKFCNELIKKVEVVEQTDDCSIICKWYNLIERNFEKFKAFTAKHWKRDYNDKDDFIEQWIREIHYYMAGYVPEDFYNVLIELVNTLE